jgi:lysophospholipase L1-like esterase
MTEGLQVADEQLFTVLWERQRPGLEVVNAGVSGYGTVQELFVAQRLDPLLRPDLHVLVVFEGNDLTDNVMPFDEAIGPRPYADASGQVHALEWDPFRPLLLPIPGAAWLHRHSLAAYVLHKRYLSAVHGLAYVEAMKAAVPDDGKWQVLGTLVARLAAGRRLAVVALPTRESVVAGSTEFAHRLGAASQRAGARFVDLQPVLRPEHYLREDFHLNAEGHRAVATRLASKL